MDEKRQQRPGDGESDAATLTSISDENGKLAALFVQKVRVYSDYMAEILGGKPKKVEATTTGSTSSVCADTGREATAEEIEWFARAAGFQRIEADSSGQ